MSVQELQRALPTWVKIERRPEAPEVTESTLANVRLTEVFGYPEAPTEEGRADVHFVLVAPTEGFPEQDELVRVVREAIGEGEFTSVSAEELSGGPSYITLGGWLGSQDLALMLIGAMELAGLANAVTPKVLGLTGETAQQMAGNGFVMLGPWMGWTE